MDASQMSLKRWILPVDKNEIQKPLFSFNPRILRDFQQEVGI